jgi:FkbM family methyltransferase
MDGQPSPNGFARGPALPVLAGPLRGLRWLPFARGKILRHVFGSYEPRQTAIFAGEVGAGACVLDIGANTGHYTLLGSLLVGPAGRVVAIEPDPRNRYFLAEHVRLNRLANVTMLPVAIGREDGQARFGGDRGSGTRRLSKDGSAVVDVRSIDSIVAEIECAPTCIKMDVEGAELEALKGAEQTLSRLRPVIMIATHGAERRRACLRLLAERGYRTTAIDGKKRRNFLCIPNQPA